MAQDPAAYVSNVGNHGNSVDVDEDGDDWEYEYDGHETEDFYFTLDLTTHVPNALVQAEASLQGRHKTPVNSSARHSTAVDAPNGQNADSSDEEDEPSAGQLQIVDLYTTRPLVKLDENVYTCSWQTDLGTQFHVAKAGDVNDKVRRAGTVLDIISTSQTRLIGIPVTLQPRNDTRRSRTPGASANHALSIDGSDIDADETSERFTPAPGSVAEPGKPLQIDRTLVKHQAGSDQASFLERLSQIKLKKGETDQVPIFSVKQYHHVDPAKQAELKQAARALDAQRRAKAKAEEVVATGQRPRKRRRKLTHAERGIDRGSNAAGAGRPGRDAVTQRLGFSDEAPPADRNGRWARQQQPAEAGPSTMSDAPDAENENGEPITTAEQTPGTATPVTLDATEQDALPPQEGNNTIEQPELMQKEGT